MTDFRDKVITLECSACSKTFRATAEQLSHSEFGCPHCGDTTEASLGRKGLADARRVLDELKERRGR